MGFWRSAVNTVRSGGRIASGVLRGGSTAVKTAAVGGATGYVAWETLVNDKPLAKIASEMVIGSENTEKLGSTVDSAIETVNTAAGAVKDVAHTASDTINSVGNAFTGGGSVDGQTNQTGVGNFIQGISSGNGLGMIGDFFRNIGEGKVSGMSFAGLIGAAFLIFGRFGWLGKIAGALIGMTILGNNLNMSRIMGGGDQQTPNRGDTATAITPGAAQGQAQGQQGQGQDQGGTVIRRGR